MNEQNTSKKATLIISGVVIAAIIAVAAWQLSASPENDQDMAQDTEQPSEMVMDDSAEEMGEAEETEEENSETDSEADDSEYADGEYSATGNYLSPAGEEEVDVTVTLEDGIVVAAEFEGQATHPTSQKLQGMFAEGFEEEVVGKSIDDISLTVVNGSSLTPGGFMDALDQIKGEAEA